MNAYFIKFQGAARKGKVLVIAEDEDLAIPMASSLLAYAKIIEPNKETPAEVANIDLTIEAAYLIDDGEP